MNASWKQEDIGMTIGDLRKLIVDAPDAAPLLLPKKWGPMGYGPETYRPLEKGLIFQHIVDYRREDNSYHEVIDETKDPKDGFVRFKSISIRH
jgi:hypothetical protein